MLGRGARAVRAVHGALQCCAPAAHRARPASTHVVLAKEVLHGLRPTTPAIREHIAGLLRKGAYREAIVETYTAARVLADVGKENLLQMLDVATRNPTGSEMTDAVWRLSELLLFSPHISAHAYTESSTATSAAKAPEEAPEGRCSNHMITTLTPVELRILLSALATYGHHSRVLLVVEHAVHQGVPLDEGMLAALLRAFRHASETYRYSEDQVLRLYASSRRLLAAAGVKTLSPVLARGLLQLLLKPTHLSITGTTRHLAATVAAVSSSSSAGGAAETGAARDAGEEAEAAFRLATATEAALQATRTLVERADPLIVAASELLAEVPEPALVHRGVLVEALELCLRRGRRDKALQILSALQARGVAIPTSVFNALLLADAPVAFASSEVYLAMMRNAGAAPGASPPLRQLVHYRCHA